MTQEPSRAVDSSGAPAGASAGAAKGGISVLGAWSLAFGCAVGWGSFVMPGNVFLPKAGPLGTALGEVR